MTVVKWNVNISHFFLLLMKLLFLFLDLAMIIIEDVITQNSMLKQVLVILVIVLRHYIDSSFERMKKKMVPSLYLMVGSK